MQSEAASTKPISLPLNDYKLRAGDMLNVRIQTLDEKTFRLFNAEWQTSTQKTEIALFVESYFVSDSGNIHLPIIGNVSLSGLTIEEAERVVQTKVDEFLLDANIKIRLLNYKITVLGEVGRPGTFRVYDSHVNILEAISMAGDLTVFGNRQNILVLRKSENNKTQRLDISDINVINSEFFYLKPHDVVYVEPLKAKTLGFKEFPFSILFSSITTIVVLINFFSK